MVRPKAQPLPRLQDWDVLREDPETREVELFMFTCTEGFFPTFYSNLGLLDGGTHLFDLYEDEKKGRMERFLVRTYRS
jgi:hypothetical protein